MAATRTTANPSLSEPHAPGLDRASSIPLHRQLTAILLQPITDGAWPVGTLLPREIDFMTLYGVSRYTVRQALDELVQSGHLVRTKRLGTVVSRPKVEQDLSHFYSFARDMTAQGKHPTSRLLALGSVVPDAHTAAVLGVTDPDQMVTYLCRLRMIAAEPVVIEESYLRLPTTVRLDAYDWRETALYDVLDRDYAIRAGRAEETLEPILLAPDAAQRLGTDPHRPAFRVERVTYSAETDQPFERRVSIIRGDRYRFHITLHESQLWRGSELT